MFEAKRADRGRFTLVQSVTLANKPFVPVGEEIERVEAAIKAEGGPSPMQSRLAELEEIRDNSGRFTLVQSMILSGKPTVPVGEEIERTKEVIAKERAAGYRLAYNAGASPSFELLRYGRSGERRLATHGRRVNLEDNYRHRILFVRDESGGMSVSVDGKTLVQVSDRSFRDPFNGLTLVNDGGEFAVREISVMGVQYRDDRSNRLAA